MNISKTQCCGCGACANVCPVQCIDMREDAELPKLMTSKYLQAVTGDVFQEVESVLKTGREVLFSGTPCHINALRSYLHCSAAPRNSDGDYENLFCVDVICHGTPSPKVWRLYAEEFEQARNARLSSVSFRCKERTWRDVGICMKGDGANHTTEKHLLPAKKDSYMKLFLRDYSLRPSCYACASKTFRLSDLTIGDFWGIEDMLPALDDAKGTSLVLIRTEKGDQVFESIRDRLHCAEVSYREAVRDNYPEYRSVDCPPRRGEFFQDLNSMTVRALAKKYAHRSFFQRAIGKVIRIGKKMATGGGENLISLWLADGVCSEAVMIISIVWNVPFFFDSFCFETVVISVGGHFTDRD